MFFYDNESVAERNCKIVTLKPGMTVNCNNQEGKVLHISSMITVAFYDGAIAK